MLAQFILAQVIYIGLAQYNIVYIGSSHFGSSSHYDCVTCNYYQAYCFHCFTTTCASNNCIVYAQNGLNNAHQLHKFTPMIGCLALRCQSNGMRRVSLPCLCLVCKQRWMQHCWCMNPLLLLALALRAPGLAGANLFDEPLLVLAVVPTTILQPNRLNEEGGYNKTIKT